MTSTSSLINGLYIIANISGSGSGSTWTLSASPGTTSGQALSGQTGILGSATASTVDALADLKLITNKIKGSTGTTQITTSASGTTLALAGDTINLQTAAAASLVGNKISYNRVYGQWQYDATITPAASNTAYAIPFQGANATTDFANIASTASTSHIIPGAAGMYKLQFSIQVANADNASEHTAYFWWRKNGTDVTGSMGQVVVGKGGGGLAIIGWDNMISSANTTDYWELMYAVDDTNITLPYYAATAFGPATAAAFLTLIPIGA